MKSPKSINELLAATRGKLQHLKAGAQAADDLLTTVRASLPAECSGSVWGASDKQGEVTLMVGSPSDATRLHYELPALKDTLTRHGHAVRRILLRVRPAPPAGG